MNLTLIDLPGLTKVAVGKLLLIASLIVRISLLINFDGMIGTTEGQPDSIVGDIENMVRSYIEKVKYHCQSSYLFCCLHSDRDLHRS